MAMKMSRDDLLDFLWSKIFPSKNHINFAKSWAIRNFGNAALEDGIPERKLPFLKSKKKKNKMQESWNLKHITQAIYAP